MSRDFILVFSGGVVSLMTTLVVLFVMDYIYRRDQQNKADQSTQASVKHEAATKSTPVAAVPAKSSEQKVVVEQTLKPHDANPPVHQPASDQTKPKAEDTPAPKPSASPVMISIDPAPVVVKPAVEASSALKSDDAMSQKAVVDQKPEPKAAEKTLPAPVAEQKIQPIAVEHKPKSKADDTSEEPAAENKPEPKVTVAMAQDPVLKQESQPVATSEAKAKPPHMVPPEKIKKKSSDEHGARPAKEHDG